MRLVTVEDLKDGDVLANDVLLEDYTVVLGKGTVIKEPYIEKLRTSLPKASQRRSQRLRPKKRSQRKRLRPQKHRRKLPHPQRRRRQKPPRRRIKKRQKSSQSQGLKCRL